MNSDFLGLVLTGASETAMTFFEWRTLMNGTGATSNMNLIDKAIKGLSYIDMSDSYTGAAGGEASYLISLGDGKFCMTANGYRFYMNSETHEGVLYSKLTTMSDDSIVSELYFINGMKCEETERTESGTTYITDLHCGTPTARTSVANMEFVLDSIADEKRLVFYNGDVKPFTGSISRGESAIANFTPTPRSGDYILGTNGAVGRITGVNSGVVVWTGTGVSLTNVLDMTDSYNASSSSNPVTYLSDLGPGEYVLSPASLSSQYYTSKNVETGGLTIAEITEYGIDDMDPYVRKYTYADGLKILDYTVNADGVRVDTELRTSAPYENDMVANKAYVDRLEARIAALEQAASGS